MPVRKKRAKTAKEPTCTISFRVDERARKQLDEEASSFGMSRGAYARRLVLDVLEDAEREQIREEIQDVREEVSRLRDNLASVLEMLLLNVAKVKEEDVRRWVSENLRH